MALLPMAVVMKDAQPFCQTGQDCRKAKASFPPTSVAGQGHPDFGLAGSDATQRVRPTCGRYTLLRGAAWLIG